MQKVIASTLALIVAVVLVGMKSAADARLEALEKTVKQSSITLKSPDGKNTVTISAEDHAVGIWLSRGDMKELIAIYSVEGQSCIGMYPHGKAEKGSPVAIGIGLDGGGKPYVQYQDGEKFQNVPPNEL